MLLTEAEKIQYTEDNMKLIYHICKSFLSSGIPDDELISIAMVGFVKALNAYDTERNVKFSTFSMNCMKNEILFFLRKEKKHMINNISMGIALSVDKNGNNLCLEDIIPVGNSLSNSIEENYLLSEEISTLEKALELLTATERFIITHRYGLRGSEILTQHKIAQRIGMSQANVSKMENGILKKINGILTEMGM